MLKTLDLRGTSPGVPADLPRPDQAGDDSVAVVRDVLAAVRARGDEALRELTRRFDGIELGELRVPVSEVAAAPGRVDAELAASLRSAAGAIEAFHRRGRAEPRTFVDDGIEIAELLLPVERVGVYAPGGRATYPSSVLMTAIPARVAGVDSIACCAPPGPDGSVPATILAAAAIAGVDEVYRIGGAQAIAALAYGTESIRRVDVVVGPGSRWVSIAEREVRGTVGVPAAFAGPSEVVVVADGSAPVEWAAIDVIVQAEHGPDGFAWLVTWSADVAAAVTEAVERLVAASPRRDGTRAALESGGYAVLVDGPEHAMAVVEHDRAGAPGADGRGCRASRRARAPRRGGLSRSVRAGVLRGLPRRAEPRAADVRDGAVFLGARHGGLPPAQPRHPLQRGGHATRRGRRRDHRRRRGSPRPRRVGALARRQADLERRVRRAGSERPRPVPRCAGAPWSGYHSPQVDVAVRLNTNEAPEPPPAEFVAGLAAAVDGVALNRYPDRRATRLRAAIAGLHHLDASQVFCANGSNEVIQSLLLAYGGPGRSCALFEPTYALHAHIARLTSTAIVEGERNPGYLVDLAELERVLAAGAKSGEGEPAVVFLCSPNNPTGLVEPDETVEAVLGRAPASSSSTRPTSSSPGVPRSSSSASTPTSSCSGRSRRRGRSPRSVSATRSARPRSSRRCSRRRCRTTSTR